MLQSTTARPNCHVSVRYVQLSERNVTILAKIKKQKQYTNHQLSLKHNTNMQRNSCFSSHVQYELIVHFLLTFCYR